MVCDFIPEYGITAFKTKFLIKLNVFLMHCLYVGPVINYNGVC